ncbi:E3 ubiquitin-protein ligase PRT1-like isoform X5 [Camellia sinensis]|uniref:E3 ubiquitin-protein ligase PRT1-like isoform X5 n=1 Tax=Camellia sinensis TaxID=4442 RepID=UPI001035C9C9|nr:E3 ubiquitin-protein ligase PRT1-like isoform X5 [Camellia sinensis]
MNNQLENAAVVEAEEEILDEFQCCVCLDLLYKPVVLGCGHISCFWCVFRAMDLCLVSHCPVCRHPYNHFPSICQLLHFLLLKLYPIAYKRREQQVIAEEKILDQFSPQLDNCLSGSEPIKEPYIHSGVPPHSTTSSCNNVSLGPCSMVEGESESTIAPHKNDKMPIPAKSTFEATKNVPFGQTGMLGDKFNKQQNSKLVLIADFLCSICKKLLYRPVVLNCGHGLTKARKNAAWLSTLPTTDYRSMLSSGGPKVHVRVGCDYCGMCPIIGERYRCKDCKERMGFDLCEDCYNSSSKLPGRFNQQHTPDHTLEIVLPMYRTN